MQARETGQVRLSSEVRKVFGGAKVSAKKRKKPCYTSADLLVAILQVKSSISAALRDSGLTLAKVAEQVESISLVETGEKKLKGTPLKSMDVRSILKQAKEEAAKRQAREVSLAIIVFCILCTSDCDGRIIIENLGIDFGKLLAAM